MNVHSLELNDIAISLFRDTQLLVKSPGFAVRDDKQIFMGVEAQRRARLLPRQLNHRFWSQLNLEPMPHSLGHWSRHADIAHAHLHAVSEQANNPEEIILVVPGSYQSDQMALLLGMSRECQFTAVGLIDAALAATILVDSSATSLVHLDLQLHQALVTRFDKVNSNLQRKQVISLPGVGLLNLFDTWARFITSECIRQTRFDPMHNAIAEQELYNELPSWLNTLHSEREIIAQLQGYQFRLNRQQLLLSCESSYAMLSNALDVPGTTVVLSHRIAQLPGFSSSLQQAVILKEDSVAKAITHFAQTIRDDRLDLEFVTALVKPKSSVYSTTSKQHLIFKESDQHNADRVTHVIWRHKAYPLCFSKVGDKKDQVECYWIGTQIPSDKEGLRLDDESELFGCKILHSVGRVWLSIEPGSESFFTFYQLGGAKNRQWTIQSGDTIRITGSREELVFIQVLDR